MIYTSYYGNHKNFPRRHPITIQISNSAPFKTSFVFNEVFPNWATMVKPHKEGKIDEQEYTRRYLSYLEENKEDILSKVKIFDSSRFQGRATIMLCYCKKESFCHRHILREWLHKYGVECKEL